MDKLPFLVLPILFSILIFQGISGQSDSSDGSDNSTDVVLSQNWSYCFEFSWFGPNYDNYTRYNGTCTDYLDDTRAKNVPCSDPIVITYDGSRPDIDYLWEHHRNSVLCKMSNTQKCVKYTYLINGQVRNATYMCAEVQGSSDDGCVTQKVDGYTVEACVCKSGKGIYKPCNDGTKATFSVLLLLFVIFVNWFVI